MLLGGWTGHGTLVGLRCLLALTTMQALPWWPSRHVLPEPSVPMELPKGESWGWFQCAVMVP